MNDVLLSADRVTKHFPMTRGVVVRRTVGRVRAVDGVSLELRAGETLGVVGESGCGKSTLARVLMALERPTSGTVTLLGEDLHRLNTRQLRRARRNIQIIFQDPYSSLDPRMTVHRIVSEPFEIHRDVAPRGDRRRRTQELLELVGLNPEHLHRYPHQFSGGQRQRIGIARALALRPRIIVCDEPVSALDVSVQAQVVNLLESLQDELGLSYLFVAHDLSVVRHISDRVAVMYLGRIVESGGAADIYQRAHHPYTQALLSAVPVPDPRLRHRRRRIVLTGDLPSPAHPPAGCHFNTRCWKATEVCQQAPPLSGVEPASGTHLAACHHSSPLPLEEASLP